MCVGRRLFIVGKENTVKLYLLQKNHWCLLLPRMYEIGTSGTLAKCENLLQCLKNHQSYTLNSMFNFRLNTIGMQF